MLPEFDLFALRFSELSSGLCGAGRRTREEGERARFASERFREQGFSLASLTRGSRVGEFRIAVMSQASRA
jgi:hypothetical protein